MPALGLLHLTAPAQAETAFSLNVDPEVTTVEVGLPATLTASISQAKAVATEVDVEFVDDPGGDGETYDTPDAGCTVAAEATSCTFTASRGDPGTVTVVSWIDLDADDASCEADRQLCTGSSTEETQAGGGIFNEPDTTDIVTVRSVEDHPGLDCASDDATAPVAATVTVSCYFVDRGGQLVQLPAPLDVELLGWPGRP